MFTRDVHLQLQDFEVFEEEMGKYQWERIEADLQVLDMEAGCSCMCVLLTAARHSSLLGG